MVNETRKFTEEKTFSSSEEEHSPSCLKPSVLWLKKVNISDMYWGYWFLWWSMCNVFSVISFFFCGGHSVIEKTEFRCDLESSLIFVHVCTNADTLDSEQERQFQWSFLTNHFLCVSMSFSWNVWIFVSNQMFSSESLLTFVCDRQHLWHDDKTVLSRCLWEQGVDDGCRHRNPFSIHCKFVPQFLRGHENIRIWIILTFSLKAASENWFPAVWTALSSSHIQFIPFNLLLHKISLVGCQVSSCGRCESPSLCPCVWESS